MLEKKKVLIALMLLIAVLLLPNMVNATVEYTRSFPSDNGTIKLHFTGLNLEQGKVYKYAIVRQNVAPTEWFSLDDGYTTETATITLSPSEQKIENILKATDTAYIYIKGENDAVENSAVNAYEVSLKLPYLQSLQYTKTSTAYDIYTIIYGEIGANYDWYDKVHWQIQEVTDRDFINEFLENKNDVLRLEEYLPNPPTSGGYSSDGCPEFEDMNDGLYLVWVYRVGTTDCKTIYSCIIHDGLPNATTLEEYVGVVNGAPKVESVSASTSKYTGETIGTYNYVATAGTSYDEVEITVKFDQDVVVNQNPTLKIKFGTGEEISVTTGTVSAKAITYKYKVKETDKGVLQVLGLSGGNVTNNEGTAAVLTLPEFTSKVVAVEGTNTPEEPEGTDNNKKTFNNHSYQIIDKLMSWQEAKEYCEFLGGYLVTITSSEEQAFITSFVKEKGFTQNRFWMGATDKEKEGTWKWITGEKFSYTNWGTGQPNNNEPGGQNFGIYVGKDNKEFSVYAEKWDDINEGSEDDIYFICEWGDLEKETTTTDKPKDTTTAKDNLPNTGRVLLLWIIGIVTVSGLVAHIRYKKLYF